MTVHIRLDAESGTPAAAQQLQDACATILRAGNEHFACEKAKYEAKKNRTQNQRDVAEYLHSARKEQNDVR